MNRPWTYSESHFLLVGNGSYQNRGCEAILRGTMEILRYEFGPSLRANAGVFSKPEVLRDQTTAEIDAAVDSFPLTMPGGPRWSLPWLAEQSNRRLGTAFYPHLKDLKGPANTAMVALQIGGDHYSLDYGKPLSFMAIDRFLAGCGVPVVLWGVSVGPFDADPVFSKQIFKHLRSLSGIFVRESESLDYLRANGVSENVHLMGDPAFVMQSVEPDTRKIGFNLPEGSIGINLSPMLAFYRGIHPADVDLNKWRAFCADLVKSAATLGRPILLVPHVGSTDPGNDDFAFLELVHASVAGDVDVPVHILPRGLSAAASKWAISQCAVFAGGRTHSTIAALSTHVPTLSIGYSLKARGINRDVYGHLDNCIAVSDLTVASFTERLVALLEHETAIRKQLAVSVSQISNRAMNAGATLRKIIAQHPSQ